MVTLVGTQSDFSDVLFSLIELDLAAIASYQEAMESLETQAYKTKLEEFKADHQRHVSELSEILKDSGQEPPVSAGIKQIFTQGKVMFAHLIGDKAILKAMNSNEDDTNTAYERANNHANKISPADLILKKGLEDERKHRAWLQETIHQMD